MGLSVASRAIRSGKDACARGNHRDPHGSSTDIPTVGDFVPGYEAIAFWGIGAPKATPSEIIERLNKVINAGLADPKIKERLADWAAHSPVRLWSGGCSHVSGLFSLGGLPLSRCSRSGRWP